MKINLKAICTVIISMMLCASTVSVVAASSPRKTTTQKKTKTGKRAAAIKLADKTFIGNIYTQAEYWVELSFNANGTCDVKQTGSSINQKFTATYKVTGKKVTLTIPGNYELANIEKTPSFTISGYGTYNCKLEWDYGGPRGWEGTLNEEF